MADVDGDPLFLGSAIKFRLEVCTAVLKTHLKSNCIRFFDQPASIAAHRIRRAPTPKSTRKSVF